MKFLRLIRTILREIFDEAAYERFCLRELYPRNQRSYREFLKESAKPRIKCC